MGLHLENEVTRRVASDHQVVKTPIIILNKPVPLPPGNNPIAVNKYYYYYYFDYYYYSG